MLSSSCRYGIRAVIYLASLPVGKGKTGIKQISKDLDLPTPFLAKILQQMVKEKILNSSKGPHGGFSLLKDPAVITLLDIVKTIDGDKIFTSCIMHKETCKSVVRNKKPCPIHDEFSVVRNSIIRLFKSRTIEDIVNAAKKSGKVTM